VQVNNFAENTDQVECALELEAKALPANTQRLAKMLERGKFLLFPYLLVAASC
jgi:hypothetical protein